MGTSDYVLEEERRGYTSSDRKTCHFCFKNGGIKKFIKKNSSGTLRKSTCDYCNRQNVTTSKLDDILEYLLSCIDLEYTDPANVAYYNKEDGYISDCLLPTSDMLYRLGLECEVQDLFDDICNHISNVEWTSWQPFILKENETMLFCWEDFSNYIKHESRYVFFRSTKLNNKKYDDQEINPNLILDIIGDCINKLKLTTTITLKEKIYRGRYFNITNDEINAKALGTPLPEHTLTTPNRMNPFGIPMFYGALDKVTAISEIWPNKSHDDKHFVIGEFSPTRELLLIDLTKEINNIDFFDLYNKPTLRKKLFLKKFIEIINMPVDRNNIKSSYIEYIPTQVVTEYFKVAFKSKENKNFDGFMYSSSKNKEPCLVLFIKQDECADSTDIKSETLLSLSGHEIKSYHEADELINASDF